MRKLILLTAVLTTGIFVSCSGEDVEPTSGIINCNIDGVYWESAEAYAAITDGKINVTGLKDGDLLTITVDDEGEGEYDLGEDSGNGAAYTFSGASNSFLSNMPNGKGLVSITSIDMVNETVSGIFEFTAIQSDDDGEKMKVKDGHFEKIPFNVEPESTDNELFAKVNGEDFNATYVYAGSSFDRISISANVGGTAPTIGLNFPDDVTEGTYEPSMFGDYRAQYVTDGEDISAASEGNITITSHDLETNIVEGTFDFVDGAYNITDGTFTIQY